jgi:hypothetical protein
MPWCHSHWQCRWFKNELFQAFRQARYNNACNTHTCYTYIHAHTIHYCIKVKHKFVPFLFRHYITCACRSVHVWRGKHCAWNIVCVFPYIFSCVVRDCVKLNVINSPFSLHILLIIWWYMLTLEVHRCMNSVAHTWCTCSRQEMQYLNGMLTYTIYEVSNYSF